jgi:group II intron reverse transcriptase/maturase
LLKKSKLRNNEYYGTQEMLDKLYERGKKGHKFKNLKSLITSRKNILLAYRTIKSNSGSRTSGVNNTTIEDIAKWETDELVEYVRNRLKYYIPQPVKRVYIPKPDGRKRPLGIPTIEDRIIQQSIKQILEPICESKFHNHSYGFRPNRSTKHAIARSMHLINISGLHFTVDVDIAGFFDNVDHGKLLKQLWSMGIQDKSLLSILSSLLKAEIKGKGIPEKGTPQGGIISPLLANVVLNELDWWISNQWETFESDYKYSEKYSKLSALKKTDLKEIYIVRYADDLKIFCRNYETASKIKIAVQNWLNERLNLEVSKKKTKITNLKTSYSKFLGVRFKVIKKGNKYVCKSRINKNTKSKLAYKLKQKIKEVQRETTSEQVLKLNSMILGMHQYYSMATHVNIDFSNIAFKVNRVLENRLNVSERGYESRAYQKFYGKYNFKPLTPAIGYIQ